MLFPSTATFSAQEEITCHRKVRIRLVSRQPLLGSETICKVRDFSWFSIYRSYVPLLWKPPSRSIEVGTWQDFQGHVREAVDHPALKVPAMRVIYVQLERLGSFSMGSWALPFLGLWNTFRTWGGLSLSACGTGAMLILRQKREGLGALFAASPSRPMHFKTISQMFSCWVRINISFCLYSTTENPHAVLSSHGWALGLLIIVWWTRKSKRNEDSNMTEIQLN